MEERVKTNYDHPMAFDNDLLVEHLQKLIKGEAIEKPRYDFTIHNRAKDTTTVEPREIIIVEGILILEDERIRDLLDIKVYVDTDADIRILRRLLFQNQLRLTERHLRLQRLQRKHFIIAGTSNRLL